MSRIHLPTMAEIAAERAGKAIPKAGTPTPIAQKARKVSRKQQADTFRQAVWTRDKDRCRATGRKLAKSGVDWELVGEIDHAYLRSTSPEKIYDPSNGILIQKALNRMRKVACVRAPEFKRFDYTGPDDRGLPQQFVWRDEDGTITKERWG